MLGRHVAYLDKELTILESEVPPAPPGGVVARVTMAGVCGTDAHRLAGEVPGPDEPISLGHETVGVVAELGEGVTTDCAGQHLEVGDRIAWLPGDPCHRCHACVNLQNEILCEVKTWPALSSMPNAAGFRDYATLQQSSNFYRIADDTPDEAAVAFGCALPTALGLMDRLGRIEPGQTVVVQGTGPVGLASILLASQSPARSVIAIGAGSSRLGWARTLGADECIDLETTSEEERLTRVKEVTGGRGAEIVIEATGFISAFAQGINLLAPHGRYVIAGLYAGDKTTPFNPVTLNNRNLQIIGSYFGRASHRLQALSIIDKLHRQLNLADMVSHRFPLEQTREAIDMMSSGNASKVVIVP